MGRVDRHCVRPGLGYQDLKLKRDGHTVQGERMMTAILGAQLSFPIRFLVHIPEHLKDILLVKAVRWHFRVSGLGTEHQWEHDLPLCSSIPPCRGWDRVETKSCCSLSSSLLHLTQFGEMTACLCTALAERGSSPGWPRLSARAPRAPAKPWCVFLFCRGMGLLRKGSKVRDNDRIWFPLPPQLPA